MDQTKNIRLYGSYLEERIVSYRDIAMDMIREEDIYNNRIKDMKWKSGLEKEIKVIQRIIKALLECRFFTDSINNDITTECFRLLVRDLMRIFSIMNLAVMVMLSTLIIVFCSLIVLLEQFFALSKSEALSALELYKVFVELTEKTVEYFAIARRVEIGIAIPELNHVSDIHIWSYLYC
jgi:phosphatidylinositol-binding clathrin assembly protein